MRISRSDAELIRRIEARLRLNKYMGQHPTLKQKEAMTFKGRELFYGGAAGGGKSSLLLLGALQYVDIPGYSAGIFRRKFSDLTKPKGLIDRSHQFLDGTEAKWTGWNHRWTFPSGAMLSFWGLEYAADVHDHTSSEYHFVGFEELPDFLESQYTFMFSRQRGVISDAIPIRCWSVGNPPSEKQRDADWIRPYFIEAKPSEERLFIPAFMEDNPHLNQEEYEDSLGHVDEVMRARNKAGDWRIQAPGKMFQTQWYEIVEAVPAEMDYVCRAWDMAATKPRSGKPPDWTVGLLMGRAGHLFFIIDVVRMQGDPGETEATMKQTTALDRLKWGERYMVREEQEGGSSGKTVIFKRTQEMAGYDYEGSAPRESKAARARPVAVQAKAGNIKVLNGPWNKVFLDEHPRFPFGTFDDQVDAESLALGTLANPTDNVIEYLKMQAEKAKGMQHVRPRA